MISVGVEDAVLKREGCVAKVFRLILAAAGMAASCSYGFAAGPVPSGATGQCKDGTYSMSATRELACRGHQGVKDWYASTPAAAAQAPALPVSTAASAAAAPPAASEGTAGTVWVNVGTKIYHCPGSHFYGTTKEGKYMSEAEARAMGARPDHNRPCVK